MYTNSLFHNDNLLFADTFFASNCIIWISRYHSDGRKSFDVSDVTILVNTNSSASFLLHPFSWKSNTAGSDTPVLVLKFCDERLRKYDNVIMIVQYKLKAIKSFNLARLKMPLVEAAACTSTALADLWSARAWIEHHRYLGVGRFTIYINDYIPDLDDSLTGTSLKYLLSQPDVILVEWPFPFKDPNTTRDKVYSPMHYARPLEWNSCNEREHYGAKVTLFNDMDEFVVSKYSLYDQIKLFPTSCRAIQLVHYWVKLSCPVPSTLNRSLIDLYDCQAWRETLPSLDTKRRVKLIVRTESSDVPGIFNHDLSDPVEPLCRTAGKRNVSALYHFINLRPNSE